MFKKKKGIPFYFSVLTSVKHKEQRSVIFKLFKLLMTLMQILSFLSKQVKKNKQENKKQINPTKKQNNY